METAQTKRHINQKLKTNSGYKHNDKAHFIFDLTFRMLQHTSSEVTVEQVKCALSFCL